MSRSRRNIIINSNENESLDLGINVDDNSVKETEIIEHDIKPVDVPPKSLYGNDLKKIKSFKKLRKSYKLKNQKQIFISDLKELLKLFPAENHQYDDELLIEILNIAESFFIYGTSEERENIKNECISELMKPYFKNDQDLLMKTISHIWHHVNKSNLRRRLWARFKNFFYLQNR
jgi:hypothetical protein